MASVWKSENDKRRESIAVQIMAAIIIREGTNFSAEDLASDAINFADALIRAIDKPQQ